MSTILPAARPRLSSTVLKKKIADKGYNITNLPIIIIGIRGYYLQSMGHATQNDRGIYDDAIYVLTQNASSSFNANTDPSGYRKGHGKADATKGMATLKPGLWLAHRFGKHNASRPSAYDALIQIGGSVTVVRDGTPDYEDSGYFGINIHKGGKTTTSSQGCQTIHPDQWDGFYNLVLAEAKRIYGSKYKSKTIPYLLINNLGDIV